MIGEKGVANFSLNPWSIKKVIQDKQLSMLSPSGTTRNCRRDYYEIVYEMELSEEDWQFFCDHMRLCNHLTQIICDAIWNASHSVFYTKAAEISCPSFKTHLIVIPHLSMDYVKMAALKTHNN